MATGEVGVQTQKEAKEARMEVPVWKEGVVKERLEWNENRERRRGRRVRD